MNAPTNDSPFTHIYSARNGKAFIRNYRISTLTMELFLLWRRFSFPAEETICCHFILPPRVTVKPSLSSLCRVLSYHYRFTSRCQLLDTHKKWMATSLCKLQQTLKIKLNRVILYLLDLQSLFHFDLDVNGFFFHIERDLKVAGSQKEVNMTVCESLPPGPASMYCGCVH